MNVDLSTRYLGLTLKNPLGVSACPLTRNLDTLRRLEEAGASVAVLPSLFEEQVRHEELEINRLYEYQAESFAESLTYFPELDDYNTGPRDYLRLVEAAKRAVSIPIIGSLNGFSPGGWVRYAKDIQNAGADALELNIYFVPTDPDMTSAEVEQRYRLSGRRGLPIGFDSRGGEDRAELFELASLCQAIGRRRRPGLGALQPLPRSGHRS